MLTVERSKSFSLKPVVFEKTFWIDPSCKKRRNFEVSIFCLVWEEVWNEICRFASSLSKLRILERQIRGSQRNCFFLLLIGDCKFFFFCGWSVSLFIFFCHLKNNSGCIVASQFNENKSNNETNFVWVKN